MYILSLFSLSGFYTHDLFNCCKIWKKNIFLSFLYLNSWTYFCLIIVRNLVFFAILTRVLVIIARNIVIISLFLYFIACLTRVVKKGFKKYTGFTLFQNYKRFTNKFRLIGMCSSLFSIAFVRSLFILFFLAR